MNSETYHQAAIQHILLFICNLKNEAVFERMPMLEIHCHTLYTHTQLILSFFYIAQLFRFDVCRHFQ